MNTMKMRVISLLLCLCMVLSIVPVTALADEAEDTPVVVEPTEEATEAATEAATEEATEAATEETTEETTPAESVKYTVAHCLWNWDTEGYDLLETEELTGKPGEPTNAQAKSYEDYILEDDIVQAEILADGTTVVSVYYSRL